jgi:membrane associated rhomboid family serine protease
MALKLKRRSPDERETAVRQPKSDRNSRTPSNRATAGRTKPLLSSRLETRDPRELVNPDPLDLVAIRDGRPASKSWHSAVARATYQPPYAPPRQSGNHPTNQREQAKRSTGHNNASLRSTYQTSAEDAEYSEGVRSNADSTWDVETRGTDTDTKTDSTPGTDDDGVEAVDRYKSMTTEEEEETYVSDATDDSYLLLRKQSWAVVTIIVLVVQLTLLLVQLCLCGIASLEVNPVFGPYPDAFSEWGGKNAYLMLDGHQYFRLVTPAFLHVGVLHFVVNALCTLRSAAIFEQEWGSCGWITVYFLSAIGAVATSCVFDPNEIGVSSSGALMGLFGAKIAQLLAYSCFELHSEIYLETARAHEVAAVLCNVTVIFLLCFITYIDMSGHAGGFVTGLFAGMLFFCRAIMSRCTRFLWSFIGFAGLVCGAAGLAYLLWFETEADEELGDACQYFRNLYSEGYECDCSWS